jgi:hypothetical protein
MGCLVADASSEFAFQTDYSSTTVLYTVSQRTITVVHTAVVELHVQGSNPDVMENSEIVSKQPGKSCKMV